MQSNQKSNREDCETVQKRVLKGHDLIIAANRGPVVLTREPDCSLSYQRASGGLVTALTGLIRAVPGTWIANAGNDTEREFRRGTIALEPGSEVNLEYILPDPSAYNDFYNQISNPLLWFLQHSMWDFVQSPSIDREIWRAWHEGYVAVNRLFGQAIAQQVRQNQNQSLIMLQDYHLYLTPRFIRLFLRGERSMILTHFIHIPWPGSEDWGYLPPVMRNAILESLCAVDLLGFQTREDGLNFIRTVESHLPRAHVNYRRGRIWYRNHATRVQDFPISIDVEALRQKAESEEVAAHRRQFEHLTGDRQVIVRIDRTEPSKNIVRGFQAFEAMLNDYPEHVGKVQFLALLVPSRLKVEQYQAYLNEFMAAAGQVNARYGTSDWEPIRVLLGEDYNRAIAAMQLYDVLLINPIADGMNLVAKEGPIVNRRNGVLILSERAGARQQLETGAMLISPIDLLATSEALHQALVMPAEIRRERAARLKKLIESNDIQDWLCDQLITIEQIIQTSHREGES